MHKLGSLFDGSGGFPLAGALCGIEPAWASEVEPYPIAVTKSRFPDMVHLGSVSEVDGAEIEPVDVITFGSPCQDLSVAGKREGLKHEDNGDEETTRSGLFMEAVRIIKEMRRKTNGRKPTFAVWENVPGAFSSSGGADLRTVFEELIKIVEPSAVMPPIPKVDGRMQIVTSETDLALLTEFLTLNTSERLRGEEGYTLSSILEADVPKKYYLSAKACEGILRRAKKRKKKLPQMLEDALLQMIEREREGMES